MGYKKVLENFSWLSWKVLESRGFFCQYKSENPVSKIFGQVLTSTSIERE